MKRRVLLALGIVTLTLCAAAMIALLVREGHARTAPARGPLPPGFVSAVFGFEPPDGFEVKRAYLLYGKDSHLFALATCPASALEGVLQGFEPLEDFEDADFSLGRLTDATWYRLPTHRMDAAYQRGPTLDMAISKPDERGKREIYVRRSVRGLPPGAYNFLAVRRHWLGPGVGEELP